MNRRDFIGRLVACGLGMEWGEDLWASVAGGGKADVVVVGGGLGGCAAALSALRQGLSVILTEENDWIGGQLTSQGVPPDEHRWIETFGGTRTYRELRRAIRQFYRDHYPLKDSAKAQWNLNPGNGSVSRLCHEPRVALNVLMQWMQPYLSSGHLRLMIRHRVISAETQGDRVQRVVVEHRDSGRHVELEAPVFVDATELGDVLPLTGTEFVTGSESKEETGEWHASKEYRAENHQAFTHCFAMDYVEGEEHLIEKPGNYNFWRNYLPELTPAWPGKLLDLTYTHPRSMEPRKLGFHPANGPHGGIINLWSYRRILDAGLWEHSGQARDISLVNWPQNDYLLGNLIGGTEEEEQQHIERAKELSLSWLYWLQTEVPRMDGGQGFPGLRLRKDVLGTEDGLAQYPYVRESRRIRAMVTVTEGHCGLEQRAAETGLAKDRVTAERYMDSIGLGSYPIDLHPTTGGDNYIDFESLPFQIPLGCVLPCRVENLIPANKNIGTTHVTNGCYRLHPVEWNIGESVGYLVALARNKKTVPRAVRERSNWLSEYQGLLRKEGVELEWPGGPW